MVGLRRFVFIVGFWLVSTAFAVDGITVLTTGDKKEAPYAWNLSGCSKGLSDLKIYTKTTPNNQSQLNFNFRNIVPRLKEGVVVKLAARDTEIVGLTFRDREGTLWAFKPSRNDGTCDLQLVQNGSRVKLWGSCMGLTDDTIAQDFTIAEENALECTLPRM